VEQIHYTKIK